MLRPVTTPQSQHYSLFMVMEQKQRDKDNKWGVSILRFTPVSTEARFKPSCSIDLHNNDTEKFKTKLCRPTT